MSLLWPIIRQAIRSPGRTAAIDDRRSYSYGQLLGGAAFLAEQIDQATATRHVGILLPTSGAFSMSLLGTWLARRVAVPLNYLLAPEELNYVIQNSDIDTIITADVMIDHLAKAAGDNHPTGPIPAHVKLLRIDQTDFTGGPPLRWPPLYHRDDLAVILYTSGTSGRPKGVMLTHGNFHSDVDAAVRHAQLTGADTFLGVLPQFHSFGLTALTLLPLAIGAKTIYSARFVPKKILSLIRKHQPDIFVAIPSMYGALLSLKNAQPDDLRSIRVPVSGGEPLPQAIFNQYLDRFGLQLLEGYGLTETAPITHWSTPHHNKRHSVGTAIPCVTVSIVSDDDQPLPPDHEGEILIAGPNVMSGYYKLPQQSRDAFTQLALDPRHAQGSRGQTRRFFRTGDIGRVDKDGFLFITGRKKEMLIIGGENVFPREIEEVLNQHETVRASAVIGMPDDLRGEVPIAFVEISDDHAFDETSLRSWCRKHLAGYKVPREIRAIDALPRNPTGKILRRNLTKSLRPSSTNG